MKIKALPKSRYSLLLAALLLASGLVNTPAQAARGMAASFGGFHDNQLDNKIYFFHNNRYSRYSASTMRMDPGYPKAIASGWPGIPDNLDAATYAGYSNSSRNNKMYLFKGRVYWRWDLSTDTMDEGYPKAINAGWPGLPDNLDAAVYGGYSNSGRNNKLYFFKGGSYWRWDIERDRLDPGYPQTIRAGWQGLPDNLDMATYGGASAGPSNNKLYFFKDDLYWRWDIQRDMLDPGYPKTIDSGWPGLATLGLAYQERPQPAANRTPAGYDTLCARENEWCTFKGVRDVAYGANGRFSYLEGVKNGIECSNNEFDDPAPNMVKSCFIKSPAGMPQAGKATSQPYRNQQDRRNLQESSQDVPSDPVEFLRAIERNLGR
ncbi:MAG: hypothetical protein G8345_04780 [Magnetococcales bacterium]|nr:hypothetical protein [Magnetococcales bacterium]NGZ26185.1 hypothetical protein [Magnetococcales bacterium]